MTFKNTRYLGLVYTSTTRVWNWGLSQSAIHHQCPRLGSSLWLLCFTLILACYSCHHLHLHVPLSSLNRPIWRHWTFKMLVLYILWSVSLRLSQFSQLSFIQYLGLCVFSIPNSHMMIVRMHAAWCIIIISKSKLWIINHCLWLRSEMMGRGVCQTMLSYIYTYP